MSIFARANKYKAKPTIYAGIRYASKAEAARAQILDAMVKSGDVSWWLPQVKFRLGCPENTYTVDFLVAEFRGVNADGKLLTIHAEDVKGVETPKFRKDKRLWLAYGAMPLHVIKGKNVEVINPGDKS